MVKTTDVNKEAWDVVKLGDFWRFVDHKNKLLTVGWTDPNKIDREVIRIDNTTIALMSDRYQDYF